MKTPDPNAVSYLAPHLDTETDLGFEAALRAVPASFGQHHPAQLPEPDREAWYEERSPIDSDISIGQFLESSTQLVNDAVAAALVALPRWSRTSWQDRIEYVRRSAHLIARRRIELAALLTLEVGKTRVEAMGEISEAVAFAEYYCDEMERAEGFAVSIDTDQPQYRTRDVLRPYGVWGVIGPFNFPAALTAGPAFAALLAGNTVVAKPATAGGLSSLRILELIASECPAGVVNTVTGSAAVGAALVEHQDVSGITFTGSHDAGMAILQRCSQGRPRPAICEMGGKNPSLVMPTADLEEAADGIAQAAFSFAGQKCSSNSRLFLHEAVADAFLEILTRRAESLVVGDPTDRETNVGPLIDERAITRFEDAIRTANSEGQVMLGGIRRDEGALGRGNFVAPTVVELQAAGESWERELFCPLLTVMRVGSFGEALELANTSPLGLTAGLYSRDAEEISGFLDGIEAGVANVNRRAGATTGGWPGVQPFGGWRGSGTTGKLTGGPYYLPLYMREQAQTVVHD